MRIICKIINNDLSQAYGRLAEIHNLIGTKLKYSTDIKYGFIVSRPEEVGEGGFGIVLEAKMNGEVLKERSLFGRTIKQTVEAILKQIPFEPIE